MAIVVCIDDIWKMVDLVLGSRSVDGFLLRRLIRVWVLDLKFDGVSGVLLGPIHLTLLDWSSLIPILQRAHAVHTSFHEFVFRGPILLELVRLDLLDRAPAFPPSPWGGDVRVSRQVVRFGVRYFRSMQGFNDEDCDSGALIIRGTCDMPGNLSVVIDKVKLASTDVETVDLSSKMQSWRSRNSVPSSSYVSVNAISQMSHSTVPVEQVLEIPPEFDPDSTEFVSDISDYATEFKQRDVVEIPLEFDPDATQLVSVERHNATKLQWEGIEIPLEFDPDSVELAPDITEYTSKLKQSHERARKLRADLAVEEQREQELSRMLKGIVTVPSLSETHKRRPRRKSSIERLRVSRHLAEEAISYFEECVSISTLDSTDFSSLEEPHQNSGGTVPQKSNSRFLLKGGSSSLGSHFPTDRHNYNELRGSMRTNQVYLNCGDHENSTTESDNQTQCSMSITGSDVSDGVVFSHAKSPGLGTRNNSSDDFDTPRSKSSCFSFTHEPVKAVDNCDVRQYLRSFSRVISKERSNYCADDYAVQKVSENRLTDMVAFKNRIEYGGLILCNIRTF
ncbi:hypothetical protein TRIUR3_27530 [Triticum urartu]|uniref:Uncharacterized protein n=1 Tax=Triticum urartu TaxID=4572 RepID=M8ABY3_TRIUA|nr:hypothetical protein TRIUR3_27530 [Triticum urartu]